MKYLILTAALVPLPALAKADEFSKVDAAKWTTEFEAAATYGRSLWDGSAAKKLSKNGAVCSQCHPNPGSTNLETYPKYQKQLGKVVAIWQMINWCIRTPMRGENQAPDSRELTALQAYIAKERKGASIDAGKH